MNKMGVYDSKKSARKLFNLADTDRKGFITFEQWSNATMDMKSLVTVERLRAVFNEFDKDGNGTMDK